jgi:hypothetical protein
MKSQSFDLDELVPKTPKELQDLFGFRNEEEITSFHNCSLDKTPGRLFLTKSYLCYASLEPKHKFSVAWRDVLSIRNKVRKFLNVHFFAFHLFVFFFSYFFLQ